MTSEGGAFRGRKRWSNCGIIFDSWFGDEDFCGARSGAGLAACACVLWLAPTTAAQSVYDQYTEQVPAANGPHNTSPGGRVRPATRTGSGGTSGGGGAAIVLPANLNEDGGTDAKTLREVATSPRFGAPNSTLQLPADSTQNSQASVSAALNAVTDGSDGRNGRSLRRPSRGDCSFAQVRRGLPPNDLAREVLLQVVPDASRRRGRGRRRSSRRAMIATEGEPLAPT